MDLPELLQSILAAMDNLPDGIPVRRITDSLGREVSVQDVRPLEQAGLVEEVERSEPPRIGFRLTVSGHRMARQIRQDKMSSVAPAAPLRDRVTKEMLTDALKAEKSIAWMSLKFDASVPGLKALIEQYDLWPLKVSGGRTTELDAPTETEQEAKQMPRGFLAPWPPDEEFLAMVDEIVERGGNVAKELCPRLQTSTGTFWKRLGDVREANGLPRKLGREGNQNRARAVAPVASSAPGQEVGTPETFEPPQTPTATNPGIPDVPLKDDRLVDDVDLPIDPAKGTGEFVAGPVAQANSEDFNSAIYRGLTATNEPQRPLRLPFSEPTRADLEQTVRDYQATMARLQSDLADALAIANQAAVETSQQLSNLKSKDDQILSLESEVARLESLNKEITSWVSPRKSGTLLLFYGPDAMDEVVIPDALTYGDEWARVIEHPTTNRRVVDVWHCDQVTEPEGWGRICVMRPGPAEVAQRERGAA